MRPLNDAGIDGSEHVQGAGENEVIEIDDSEDEEETQRYVARKKARTADPSAYGAAAGGRASRATISSNLISTISQALSPATQQARDDARAARTAENTYLQAMLFELRDARLRIDTLTERLAEQTRRADRLEDNLHRREESDAIAAHLSRGMYPPYYIFSC